MPPSGPRPTVLHLFSGKVGRAGSLRQLAKQRGWDVIDIDGINGDQFDLGNDEVWERYLRLARAGSFIFVWMDPPSETFAGPRAHRLRTPEHPYGSPGLGPADKERVRKATYVALRCAEMAAATARTGAGFAIAHPESREGEYSMLDLPEFASLTADLGARDARYGRWPFGAASGGPTRVRYGGPSFTDNFDTLDGGIETFILDEIFEHYGAHPEPRRRRRAEPGAAGDWQ